MFRVIARAQMREGFEAEAGEAAKQAKAVQQLMEQGEIMTAGCFKWERNVFIYCECIERALEPKELLPEMAPFLMNWPGQSAARKWIPDD